MPNRMMLSAILSLVSVYAASNYTCNWQDSPPKCVVDTKSTLNQSSCAAGCEAPSYARCEVGMCVPCSLGQPHCAEKSHCTTSGSKPTCTSTATYRCNWADPTGPKCVVDSAGTFNASSCVDTCASADLFQCVNNQCVKCDKPAGCVVKSHCTKKCGVVPTPAPPPAPPTPAPAPTPVQYLCDTATLQCKPNPAGGQSKTQCETVCKHNQISVEAEADASFRTFLTTYNKEYKNATEFAYRLDVFKKNLQIAEERNADGEAVHGITKFSDLTNEEFRSFYLGYKAPTGARQELDIALTDSSEAASVDWRGHSPAILTPVKNQAQCGSCWAFSATEQIETNYAMAGNAIPSLSVQQIVSCDKVDEGCNGGNTETAYAYVEKAGGLETEASYPYTSGKGKDGKCKDKKAKEVVAIKGFNTISKTEASEKKMVTQMGDSPISVCVDATKWQTYKKGILGRTCGKQLDHCVQAVGLNTDGAKPYWIVRNSWASDWGVDGYIYVEEGINACGIAKDATTVNI